LGIIGVRPVRQGQDFFLFVVYKRTTVIEKGRGVFMVYDGGEDGVRFHGSWHEQVNRYNFWYGILVC